MPDVPRETGLLPDNRVTEISPLGKHKPVQLKQPAKVHTRDRAVDEKTVESIKTDETDTAMYSPLLVDETAEDAKILNAITAIENGCTDDIFYP